VGGATTAGTKERDMTELSVSIITEHGGHRVQLLADTTRVESPPLEHLAFYVGLGGMVALGLVELPIAVALTVGHMLIGLTHRPGLEALGEALAEA
jgi:hypothetical protein